MIVWVYEDRIIWPAEVLLGFQPRGWKEQDWGFEFLAQQRVKKTDKGRKEKLGENYERSR